MSKLLKTIEELQTEILRLRRFEDACKEIENHEHLDPECPQECGEPVVACDHYDIGTIAGHRCCAEIVRKWREK